jgi:T6SS immunity protein Tdi1, C-terminal
MLRVRQDLIVSLNGVDIDRILERWRWLIPPSQRPFFATALGDLFLKDDQHRVLRLDMGDGQVQIIANSTEEFERIAADPENYSFWFGEVLVDELRAAGKVLGPGECYCYLQLPMLGGEYEPSNFRIHDVVTHFNVWGPIHKQLLGIPDGTTVEFEITNLPKRDGVPKP